MRRRTGRARGRCRGNGPAAARGVPRADRAAHRLLRGEPDARPVRGREPSRGGRAARYREGARVVIPLKTPDEIDAIGRAGEIIGRLFEVLPEHIRPGTTTAAIDRFVEDYIRSHNGAVPAFKGRYGFPAIGCISVNEEVVHGIPSARRVLEEGDLVSVDVGVKLDGWYADAARTFRVAEIDDDGR